MFIQTKFSNQKATMAFVRLLLFVLTSVSAQKKLAQLIAREDTPAHTVLGNVFRLLETHTISRTDSFLRCTILKQGNPTASYFYIVSFSGDLVLRQPLDRETVCRRTKLCRVSLDIAVTSSERPVEIFRVDVTIEDVNDNAPVFPEQDIHLTVPEDTEPNTTFPLPSAVDLDIGRNSDISYELAAPVEKFSLSVETSLDGSSTLKIVLLRRLNREQSSYELMLLARDGGFPQKTGTVTVSVFVRAVNHAPVFTSSLYTAEVEENVHPATPVLHVSASDADSREHGQVRYRLSTHTADKYPGMFSVDPTTGEVSVARILDYEDRKQYVLRVEASDGLASAHTTAIITVLDANDNKPEITVEFLSNDNEAFLPESAEPSHFVAAIQVTDKDSGRNSKVRCWIDSEYFMLVNIGENEFHLIVANRLDRETMTAHTVVVTCQDGGNPPRKVSHDVIVNVLDQNDNDPTFLEANGTVFVFKSTTIGEYVFKVHAIDADEDRNGAIAYAIEPPSEHFDIDGKSGVVSLSRPLTGISAPEIFLRIIARDGGLPPRHASTTVVVMLTWNSLGKESITTNSSLHKTPHRGTYLMTCVVVLMVTVVVSSVLIACICVIRRRKVTSLGTDSISSEGDRSSQISYVSTDPVLPRKVLDVNYIL